MSSPRSRAASKPDPPVPVDSHRRRALVFGGGGVLGFAWTVGALSALETEWGIDARAVGLTVGTSAGSMLAALLGCGIEVDVIRRHHQGVPAPADPGIEWDYSSDSGGALPPWPGFLPGSPRLLLDAVRHPMSKSAAVTLSGLLPRGRGTLEPIRAVIATAAGAAQDAGLVVDGWPTRPTTWIVATDYESGARVVFGRAEAGDSGPATGKAAPTASNPAALGDAVAASCAIPAWYSPVPIGDRLYIDGGTASNASADLVLPLVQDGTIDEVFILAPMASLDPDHPRSPIARLERVVRRAITRGVQHDAQRLRAAGARVVVLTPGPYDLEVMGANLMNPRYRTDVLQTSLLSSAAMLRAFRLSEDLAASPVHPEVPVPRSDPRPHEAPQVPPGTGSARAHGGLTTAAGPSAADGGALRPDDRWSSHRRAAGNSQAAAGGSDRAEPNRTGPGAVHTTEARSR